MTEPPPLDARARRVLLLISAIVLVDTSFYAAITPLLPFYAHELGLTKASAGVLAASYPAGTIVASLPMAWLSSRIGARPTLAIGLVLLAVSSLVFGLAHNLIVLDAARFAQGVGGAATWTAGLGWLSAAAPVARRAETLGTAFAAAVGGALLGPVVGAVARGIGTAATFAGVAVVALVLLAFTLREHAYEAAGRSGEVGRGFAAALRQPQILRGSWIVAISGLTFGILDVLLPLKMGVLGASGAIIALTFICSSGLEALTSRPIGRYADRGHADTIAYAGLMTAAVLCLVASLPDTVGALMVIGIAAGPLVGTLWIPGLAWLAEGSEQAGVEYAYAFGIQSVLWAGTQALGSAGGGALAHATSDFVPYAVAAGVALLTAVLLRRPVARASAQRTAP